MLTVKTLKGKNYYNVRRWKQVTQ